MILTNKLQFSDLDPLNNAGMHPNNDESSWRIDGWIAPGAKLEKRLKEMEDFCLTRSSSENLQVKRNSGHIIFGGSNCFYRGLEGEKRGLIIRYW